MRRGFKSWRTIRVNGRFLRRFLLIAALDTAVNRPLVLVFAVLMFAVLFLESNAI
jgi:hypothetical protein